MSLSTLSFVPSEREQLLLFIPVQILFRKVLLIPGGLWRFMSLRRCYRWQIYVVIVSWKGWRLAGAVETRRLAGVCQWRWCAASYVRDEWQCWHAFVASSWRLRLSTGVSRYFLGALSPGERRRCVSGPDEIVRSVRQYWWLTFEHMFLADLDTERRMRKSLTRWLGYLVNWESVVYFSLSHPYRDELFGQCDLEWQKSCKPTELL